MVIFNSYVKLPEGMVNLHHFQTPPVIRVLVIHPTIHPIAFPVIPHDIPIMVGYCW